MVPNKLLSDWIDSKTQSIRHAVESSMPEELRVVSYVRRVQDLYWHMVKSYLAIVLLSIAVGANLVAFIQFEEPIAIVLVFGFIGMFLAGAKSAFIDAKHLNNYYESDQEKRHAWELGIENDPNYQAEISDSESSIYRLLALNNFIVSKKLILEMNLAPNSYLLSSRAIKIANSSESLTHFDVLKASYDEVSRGISACPFNWPQNNPAAVSALVSHDHDEILDLLCPIMDDLVESTWYLSSGFQSELYPDYSSTFSEKVVSLMAHRKNQGHTVVQPERMTLYQEVVAHLKIIDSLISSIVERPHLQVVSSQKSSDQEIAKALDALSKEVRSTYERIKEACPGLNLEEKHSRNDNA